MFSLALEVSYNRPRFSRCATWNPDAITVARNETIGNIATGAFVNTNNTLYVAARNIQRVQAWLEGSTFPTRNIPADIGNSRSIFVTINGDIYADNGNSNKSVNKWTANDSIPAIAMIVNSSCLGLFIDILNNIYCSPENANQVIKKSLNRINSDTVVVAGNGTAGNATNLLNYVRGIAVDFNLTLYVADQYNHRVQRFTSGQLDGMTVVGSDAPGTITLNSPNGIVEDADGYLFITDYGDNRIIGSGPNGFRCIAGCTGLPGAASNQLNNPYSLSFDSHGNLFVADRSNNRIQKFLLSSNSCGKSFHVQEEELLFSTRFTSVPSDNRPKFCPGATWNPNAITFANLTTIGAKTMNLFVDTNNTVYAAVPALTQVQVWPQGSAAASRNLSTGGNAPLSVFVTINGDIYVDNGDTNKTVNKWTTGASSPTVAMQSEGTCYDLVVDIYENLFCSMGPPHQVIKRSLYESNTSSSAAIVAGNGTAGSALNLLNMPRGLAVDSYLSLFVADCGNKRVQRFETGQLNAKTVAGTAATILLGCPVGVILDADGYLFIVDRGNDRIIGSDRRGFRCIVGCTGVRGSASNQLNYSRIIRFDSYGNLFVTDTNNNRIQTFLLATNSCGKKASPLIPPLHR